VGPLKKINHGAKKKKKKLEWNYEYIRPKKYIKQEKFSVINEKDEGFARNLQQRYQKNKMVEWQIDYFYSPNFIRDDDNSRPYFPYIFMVVDGLSGLVLGTNLTKQGIPKDSMFRHSLLEFIKKAQYIPDKFVVKRIESVKILEAVAEILDVKIVLRDEMYFLDEAKEDFIDCFKTLKRSV